MIFELDNEAATAGDESRRRLLFFHGREAYSK